MICNISSAAAQEDQTLIFRWFHIKLAEPNLVTCLVLFILEGFWYAFCNLLLFSSVRTDLGKVQMDIPLTIGGACQGFSASNPLEPLAESVEV